MKAEKGRSKKDKSSGGFSTVATAFVTGAAAGLTVGVLIASDKGSSFRDKVKSLIREFSGDMGDKPGNENQPS